METKQLSPIAFNDRALFAPCAATIGRRLTSSLMDFFLAFTLGYVIPVLGPVLCILYFLCKDALPFLNGQSVGKKLLHLKVVTKPDAKPITRDYSSSILRSVTLLIPGLNLIELILILFHKERLGDHWAKTTVIKV